MCDCPAHRELVDCVGCPCDHTGDRMIQLGDRVRELETVRVSQNFDDVGQFHEKMGLDNVTYHGDGPRDVPPDVLEFRRNFMAEELQEFTDAAAVGDHAGMADALVDLVYVAMGTAHLLGYPWQTLWDLVQAANLQKRRPDSVDESKRGHILDVVKPAGWTAPDIEGALCEAGWTDAGKCPGCRRSYDDGITCEPAKTRQDPHDSLEPLPIAPYCATHGGYVTT